MFYSFQDSFLFAHVARTGGVSVAEALRLAAPNTRALGVQHAPLVEARDELGAMFDELFKFAFVRNPWARLVSWQGFLAGIHAGSAFDADALADPEAAHWRIFDGLVEDITQDRTVIDGISRPTFSQFHQLADAEGHILADRVGRFENLARDTAEIFAAAGLRMPPLRHENGSSHRDYRDYYSAEAREMVAEAFAEDIAAFGYTFENG